MHWQLIRVKGQDWHDELIETERGTRARVIPQRERYDYDLGKRVTEHLVIVVYPGCEPIRVEREDAISKLGIPIDKLWPQEAPKAPPRYLDDDAGDEEL